MKLSVSHVLPVAGCLSAILLVAGAPSIARAQGCAVKDGDFTRTQLVQAKDLNEPMQLAVDEDDNVYWIERQTSDLFIYSKGTITKAATIPTYMNGAGRGKTNSVGLIGMALDPNFKSNRQIYLNYSPSPTGTKTNLRVSRFTLKGNQLDLGSEQVIIEFATSYAQKHNAGSLQFGPDGSLYISTGDTFGSEGSNFTAAFATSLNPKDDNGKILRIRPKANGGYDIPSGNLFSDASKGNAEIYVMGNRNPYRIAVDPRTGWLYWGEIGSDGPRMEEFNQAREAGNYGWPAVFGDNEHTPGWGGYAAIQGQLPALKPGLINYNKDLDKVYTGATSTTTMSLRGSAAMGGPIYYYNGQSPSQHKFPPKYHGTFWAYEFDSKWIKPVYFTDQGYVKTIESFPSFSWVHMIDMKFSPAGELYVLDYGGTYRINNPNDGLYKISYNPPDAAACLPRAAELDTKTIANVPTGLVGRGLSRIARGDFIRRIGGRAFIDAGEAGEALILSLDGREMGRIELAGGRNLVPITAVAPGLYFVRLKTSQGVWEQKALL
jgi:cytochrome c